MARAKRKVAGEGGEGHDESTVVMKSEGDVSSVSIDGQEFETNDDGEVAVPLELVEEFKAHGFVRV